MYSVKSTVICFSYFYGSFVPLTPDVDYKHSYNTCQGIYFR